MNYTAATRTVAVLATITLALPGCSSGIRPDPTTTTASTPRPASMTSSTDIPSSMSTVTQHDPDEQRLHPTIASYIAENNIQEMPVDPFDLSTPTIDLPTPRNWEVADADTRDRAYGAIVYTGPEAAAYTPRIVARVSKLAGNVDVQKVIDVAPGELNNRHRFRAVNESRPPVGYPAYRIDGFWVDHGQTKFVAQTTVLILGGDGYYLLQLDADGLEAQQEIVITAMNVVDTQTTITPY